MAQLCRDVANVIRALTVTSAVALTVEDGMPRHVLCTPAALATPAPYYLPATFDS